VVSHPRAWHNASVARLRVSIVFDSGARIGPGEARLLESIRDTGSINAAIARATMRYAPQDASSDRFRCMSDYNVPAFLVGRKFIQ
jgi:hypothetical protein